MVCVDTGSLEMRIIGGLQAEEWHDLVIIRFWLLYGEWAVGSKGRTPKDHLGPYYCYPAETQRWFISSFLDLDSSGNWGWLTSVVGAV